MEPTSAELFARYQQGDETAANEIFSRYVHRLTVLARSRLSARLAQRTDAEDIVMSAYRSFFIGSRAGRFSLTRSGDLWRLLVTMTMHKLYRQATHHSAEKRAMTAEATVPIDHNGIAQQIPARDPTPEEVMMLSDDLEAIFEQLDSLGRRVLELRLSGERLADIAKETHVSERTVRRTLNIIRRVVSERMEPDSG